MLKDALHQQRIEIDKLARRYGARSIRLFGSVARGEERPDSDVDFLVELPEGYDLLKQRIPLARELAELTGREVEVVPVHELNPYFRDAVLREAVEI